MTFIACIYWVIYGALTTAVASAAHGGEYGRKAYVVALHTLAFPPAPLFWIFLRRGKQAKAELDYYSGKGNSHAIRKAYFPPLGYVMEKAMVWVHFNRWPHLNDERTQQELVGGFICGCAIALISAIIGGIIL